MMRAQKRQCVNDEIKEQISKAVIYTPTGDNCQPFSFRWEGERLWISHNDARARHALNPNNYASCLSFGCLLENVRIVAEDNGFRASENVNESTPLEGCHIDFQRDNSLIPTKLSSSINNRVTDRRFYKGGWTEEMVHQLNSSSKGYKATLKIVKTLSPKVSSHLATSDAFWWNEKQIFRDLTMWVRFSQKQANETRDGLPPKNLGVDPLSLFVVWLCTLNDKIRTFFVMTGTSFMTAVATKMKLKSSGGFTFIYVDKFDQYHLVQAGKLAQRTWLELTKAQYSVQPLTLGTLLPSIYDKSSGLTYGPEVMETVRKGAQVMKSELQLPVWGFRWGKCHSPLPNEAKTLRRADLELKS